MSGCVVQPSPTMKAMHKPHHHRNVLVKSYSTLFIEKIKDAKFPFNQIDAWLVVMEVNERPGDLFTHVFILLQLEHMLQQSQHHQIYRTHINIETYRY